MDIATIGKTGAIGAILLAIGVFANLFGLQSGLCENAKLFCPAAEAPSPEVVQAAWEQAAEIDNEASYSAFAAQFPTSPHAMRAHERSRALRETAAAAAWDAARRSGTKDAYRGFLRRHSDATQAENARAALSMIEAEEATYAWQLASATDTSDAYREFLRQHPNSAHDTQARDALARAEEADRVEAAAMFDQVCREHAERVVPVATTGPISTAVAQCTLTWLSGDEDCSQRAARAAEQARSRNQQDSRRREAEYNRCIAQRSR